MRAMENRKQYTSVVRRCGLALALGLVALVLYIGRDLIADRLATSYSLTVGFTIQDRDYRPRLERAFAKLTVPDDVNATHAFDRNSWSRSQIEVSAPTPEKAVAAARALADMVAREFDAGGETRLDVRVPTRAYPEDNPTSTTVRKGLAIGAPLLMLLAIGLFIVFWRQGRASGAITAFRGAGFAIALAFGLPAAVIALPGWLFMAMFAMAIPTAIAGLIVYKMGEVRRASRWPSAQGRIVRSSTRVVETKKSDNSSGRGNVPDVEYAFAVDGVEYRGKRISIGEIMPDTPEVQAALDRYQVGRTGPVYYNPDNPKEAVLERDPPASPRTMYTIAAGIMVVGLAVVVAFTRLGEIVDWLQPHFPAGAFIPGFLFFLAAGLVASLSLLTNLAEKRAAMRWPTVNGTVITSRAESRRELLPGGQNQTVAVWSPLVEYAYQVAGRDYHGTRIAFGPLVSGGRELAESAIAPYPVGTEVIVHYDPANPSQATLQTRIAFAWPSLVIALAMFVLAAYFAGRFGSV